MPTTNLVLIVDDDRDIRDALRETLEDHGYDVVTAVDGGDAIGQLRGGIAPFAILLDLMMPKLDGYGFLEELQRDAATAAIPVAILSAGHRVDLERIGGGRPVVRKPIKVTELIELLERLRAAGRQG